ncbi:thiol-activated cytolysin family protein [Aureisphaera galaxeae]|uniref:thiol-activated cytolysin family protein n=1 Tax=Aureisphaera galaxeae TaxID=1538023 RepID=UPI0023502398|nr:thiol-activated cytolysin family protein [Aureisphaera galaxeae]MDC8004205.1 thiol-activated cytolysin family protein [Aureisphaera galaxeae]
MKTTHHFLHRYFLLVLSLVFFSSCSTEDDGGGGENPEANSITEYILSLTYSPDVMLNVQDTGGLSSERTLTAEDVTTSSPNQGTVVECQVADYSLESNFDDVAILRPTNGIIYPGALVVGNQGLLDGAPDPFAVSRAPATLRLDLPGIGTNGNITIDDPARNSEVQAGIDEALEWWNDNSYEEGYVNAANSTYQAATSYSSTQLSLDIGLNAEWATGAIASQFEYESNTERRVASMVFKQVFYTVTMDTPQSPGSVFGSGTSLSQVEAIMTASNPPAYVASVSYGRIIMVRMETTNMDTSVSLDAVLEYSSGLNNGTGEINATYDQVLRESTLNIITIGGNAEVATSAVEASNIEDGPGGLNYIITGDNAVYSRDNPGVPIAYSIRYLKDNSLAKMGYTTDYRIEQCGSYGFSHDEITVTNDSFHDIRFRIKYRGQDTEFIYYTAFYEVDQDDTLSRTPPNGAHDVEVEFEWQYGAGDWNDIDEYTIGYNYSERCYRSTGGDIFGAPSQIAQISCN